MGEVQRLLYVPFSKRIMRKISITLQVVFFTLAGILHFVMPEFYYPLIPDYFGFKFEINILAGIAEIFLGLGSYFLKTRKLSTYFILLMLICFIPAHVHFIQIGSCTAKLCTPEWVGYLRLIIIHPILLFWVYKNLKNREEIF